MHDYQNSKISLMLFLRKFGKKKSHLALQSSLPSSFPRSLCTSLELDLTMDARNLWKEVDLRRRPYSYYMANIASHTWQVFIIDNGGNGGGSRGRNERDIYLVYRPSLLVETITNILGNYHAQVWFQQFSYHNDNVITQ